MSDFVDLGEDILFFFLNKYIYIFWLWLEQKLIKELNC